MDLSLFQKLLKHPESAKLDFKEGQYQLDTDYKKSEFIKDIICMANTKPTDSPAYIIIGVKDVPEEGHRIPKGIEKHHDDARLQDLVKDKVEPAPTFLYQSITYEGKQFGVIEIQPGYRLYQCRKNFGLLKAGVFYTRKGSTNQEATADDLEELLRDKARHMRDRTLEELSFMRRASQQQFDEAGSWTPRWFVQDLKVDKGVVDQRIQVGRLVVVKFQGKPSRKWKDPAAEIQGFWEQSREVMIPITRPLIAVRHDDIEMGEVKAEYVPLCIPGLDVDVEWREETQLEGQLWGSIKRYVVQKFLKACEGKNMICRVIYVGSSERGIYYHLNSPDYDQYLIYEWPYYKGLENALSKNRLYKHPGIMSMSQTNLQSFLTHDLIASGALEKMVPERYKITWYGRPIETGSALLVLRGLIQQHLELATSPKRDKSMQNVNSLQNRPSSIL